jgi:hypothetical protein
MGKTANTRSTDFVIQYEDEIAVVSTLYSMPSKEDQDIRKINLIYATSLGNLDTFMLNN